jgi:plastocyanin
MGKKGRVAIVLISLLLVAACAKPVTTSPTVPPLPTTPAATSFPVVTSPSVSPPATALPAASPAAAAPQTVTAAPTTNPAAIVQGSGAKDILIHGSAFDPSILMVAVGTTVTWTNKDDVAHDIKCDLPGTFNGQALQNGGTFSFTFTRAGTFNYSCDLHDCMIGTIIVK